MTVSDETDETLMTTSMLTVKTSKTSTEVSKILHTETMEVTMMSSKIVLTSPK